MVKQEKLKMQIKDSSIAKSFIYTFSLAGFVMNPNDLLAYWHRPLQTCHGGHARETKPSQQEALLPAAYRIVQKQCGWNQQQGFDDKVAGLDE